MRTLFQGRFLSTEVLDSTQSTPDLSRGRPEFTKQAWSTESLRELPGNLNIARNSDAVEASNAKL